MIKLVLSNMFLYAVRFLFFSLNGCFFLFLVCCFLVPCFGLFLPRSNVWSGFLIWFLIPLPTFVEASPEDVDVDLKPLGPILETLVLK